MDINILYSFLLERLDEVFIDKLFSSVRFNAKTI